MELTKVIITAMKEEADIIVKRFNLLEIENNKNISIFEGKNESSIGNDKIILVLSDLGKKQATKTMTYIFDNYMPDKIINIGNASTLNNNEIKNGDIILPNTFIELSADSKNKSKPFFLDYAVGESYDLNKFGLILNGVCLSGESSIDDNLKNKKEYIADIYDTEVYQLLSVINKFNMLDKCVIIKAISDGIPINETEINNFGVAINNSVDILELIL